MLLSHIVSLVLHPSKGYNIPEATVVVKIILRLQNILCVDSMFAFYSLAGLLSWVSHWDFHREYRYHIADTHHLQLIALTKWQ